MRKFYSDDSAAIHALEKVCNENHRIDDSLRVRSVKEGVIVPGKGVYDLNGHIKYTSWGGIDEYKDKVDAPKEDADVYYLGGFHPCWGHEITDGARLLWGIVPSIGGLSLSSNVKFAYTMTNDMSSLNSNFIELLEAIGVSQDCLIRVKKPTKFNTVYVADEAYTYRPNTVAWRYYTDTFRMFFEYIGNTIAPEVRKPFRKVYLSRSGWKKGNPDFGEAALERAFASKYGCEIIRPETFAFKEFVKLLRETKLLVTTEGSISHNSIFMQEGMDVVIVRKANFVSYYQIMIDEMKRHRVTYVDANFTHHFYYPDQPYFGPFLLCLNKAASEFLGIKSHFPFATYVRYRTHIWMWCVKKVLRRFALWCRDLLEGK